MGQKTEVDVQKTLSVFTVVLGVIFGILNINIAAVSTKCNICFTVFYLFATIGDTDLCCLKTDF